MKENVGTITPTSLLLANPETALRFLLGVYVYCLHGDRMSELTQYCPAPADLFTTWWSVMKRLCNFVPLDWITGIIFVHIAKCSGRWINWTHFETFGPPCLTQNVSSSTQQWNVNPAKTIKATHQIWWSRAYLRKPHRASPVLPLEQTFEFYRDYNSDLEVEHLIFLPFHLKKSISTEFWMNTVNCNYSPRKGLILFHHPQTQLSFQFRNNFSSF